MGKKKKDLPQPSSIPEFLGGIGARTGTAGLKEPRDLVFSSIFEFCVILFCSAYSLFCLNAYFLNIIGMKLSVLNLSTLLIAEFVLFGWISRSYLVLHRGFFATACGLLIFLISLGISLNGSPSLLPINWSVDYPNHYLLIDFLSTHEQLPVLTSGLGEMVQYPFGPSLFTATAAKLAGRSLMTTTGILAAVIAALLASSVYLLARQFICRSTAGSVMADAVALTGAFVVFSVPAYFIDQYCGNFYYSMMFGELLVLITLLALMHIENGERSWIFIFIIGTMGIIFSYTLYIIIPVMGLALFAVFNPGLAREIFDRGSLAAGTGVGLLFLLFTYERMQIGTAILQHEGLTMEPDLTNFGLVFFILVICGLVISLKYRRDFVGSALSVYYIIMIFECMGFLLLSQFGLIADYYAKKTLYLFILILPVVASLPVLFTIRYIHNNLHRTIAAVSIIGLIGLFSLFVALTYPVQENPVITNEDVIFAQKTETYLRQNDIPYQNVSITTGELKGYWFGLLIHMDTTYALQHFLTHATPFNQWLLDPGSRYDIGETVNASYPEFFEMNGVRLQIVVREGQKVLLKKTD